MKPYPSLPADKLTALVHALADYGHYVQPYLAAANGWEIGREYADMDVCYSTYTADDMTAVSNGLNEYPVTVVKDDGCPLKSFGAKLRLDSSTELTLSFKIEAGYTGPIAVTVDNVEYTPTESGGKYVVKIGNIPAHKLKVMHEVVITTDSGSATVTLSALSYAKLICDTNSDADAQKAAAALYFYAKAANGYLS